MDIYGCRLVHDSKKTNWFPAKVSPKRPGWYERRYLGQLRYWDGNLWWRDGRNVVCREDWRGLLTPNV